MPVTTDSPVSTVYTKLSFSEWLYDAIDALIEQENVKASEEEM